MSMENELNAMLSLGPVKGESDEEDSTEETTVEDPNLEEENEDEETTGAEEEFEEDVDETEDESDEPSSGDPRDLDNDDDNVEDGSGEEEEEENEPVEDSDEVARLKAQVAQMQTMMQQVFMGGVAPGGQNQQQNQQIAPQTAQPAEQATELDPQKLMEGIDFDQVFVDPQAFAGVLLNVVRAAQSGASQQATQAVQAAQRQQQQQVAVDNFWQQNPDLVNFRTQLAAVTQNIGSTNPNLKSTEEILETAGNTVRVLYGLKPKVGKAKTTKGKGKANVKRSLKTPAKARKQGGARRKVSKKPTGLQAELNAMFDLM